MFKLKTNLEHRTCNNERHGLKFKDDVQVLTKHTICKNKSHNCDYRRPPEHWLSLYMILILPYLLSFKNRHLIC